MIKEKTALSRCILVVLWIAATAALSKEGAKLGQFRVPEYDDRGVKKSELIGESAMVVDGIVEITNFQLDFYEKDGSNVQMRVTAPQCRYNQASSIARSDGSVRIEGDKILVTGEEFAWDGEKELFKIFRNSRVVLKGAGAQVEASREAKDQGE